MIQLAINTTLHETFCSQLIEWRKAKGLTQAALGKQMGVTQAYIAQLEAGRRTPTIDTVQSVANGLGISVENFLFLEPAEVFT